MQVRMAATIGVDLIVTHRNMGLWFGAVEPDGLTAVGTHGGLHPAEMLVSFGVARVDALL